MPAVDAVALIRVEIRPDRMCAWLVIEPGVQREMITPAFRKTLLEQAGIKPTAELDAAVEQALAVPPEPGRTVRAVIAKGVEPVPGTDGRIEWLIDQPGTKADDQNDDEGRVNFYECTSFISVSPGQTLGQIHKSTPGKSGYDVLGTALPARDGHECHLKHDDSITIRSDGQIVANRAGVLSRSRGKASIQQLLHIERNVDFHTGNLDFVGDIVINRDVRDRFEVKATGNVVISGIIEAAKLTCGGDLQVRGGFAGRDIGLAKVGGDMTARYLREVNVHVAGDLAVEREIINAYVDARGSVLADHAVILGGELCVAGALTCRNLGSEAGVRTVIRIGSVPALEPMAARLDQIIAALEQERSQRVNERQQFDSATATRERTATGWEQFAQLSQRIDALNDKLDQARNGLGTLRSRIEAKRVFDVTVQNKLFAGVEIHTPTAIFVVQRTVTGPIHITRDAHDNLIYAYPNGRSGLFGQIAQTRLAA